MIAKSIFTAVTVFALSQPVLAQSEEDFVGAFSDIWLSHDRLWRQGDGPCELMLTAEKNMAGPGYRGVALNCAQDLAAFTHWVVVANQIVLRNDSADILVLGGNLDRMTGEVLSGKPVVLDRRGTLTGTDIAAARGASGCFYKGFSSTCVDDSEIAPPDAPQADGPAVSVNVLVRLNVRAEPRDDAPVIGELSPGACIATEACITAADGTWCSALFGETKGWLAKLAIRQDRWAVTTFENSCPIDPSM